MVEYRFNNVAVLKSQTLLKERLQQILTISLSKFFGTAIFKNITEWLLWRMSTNCKFLFVHFPKLDKLAVMHTLPTSNFRVKTHGTP